MPKYELAHPIPNEQPEELYLIGREPSSMNRHRADELERMFAHRSPDHSEAESYAQWLQSHLMLTEDLASIVDMACLLADSRCEEIRMLGADYAAEVDVETAIPRMREVVRRYVQDPSGRVRNRIDVSRLRNSRLGWIAIEKQAEITT